MYLLTACSKRVDGINPPVSKNLAPPIEAIADADRLFKERENIESLKEAVSMLEKARSAGQNFEVEWKLAKYSYFLGKQTKDKAESDKLFESGRDAGKIAIRIDPGKPDGHFWYGANLGELARNNPVTVGFGSIGNVQDAMNKVIELQPDYQNASAYDALGQIEYAMRLTSGDLNKAVEYYKKGLEVDKENANLYLHLAEAYIALRKPAEAKLQVDEVLKSKPNPDYIPEHNECVAKAKKLLETSL